LAINHIYFQSDITFQFNQSELEKALKPYADQYFVLCKLTLY